MSYQIFKKNWLGKRTNIDGINGYQCVDLVKQYLTDEYSIPSGAWGNAKDYWLSTPAAILAKFSKSSTPQVGGLAVFKGINGNPYGHIGIVDSVPANQAAVTVLEQNGSTGTGNGLGGNAIRTRAITTTRVYGYLNPKAPASGQPMPVKGSRVRITINRTAFEPGTDKVKGTLKPGGGYDYLVYDVRGYRVLLYSASAGGMVEVALYYKNGVKIEGWS